MLLNSLYERLYNRDVTCCCNSAHTSCLLIRMHYRYAQQDVFKVELKVAHVSDPYTAISDNDCSKMIDDMRSIVSSNNNSNTSQYADTATAYRPYVAPLKVVIDNTLPFAAYNAQTRVFNLTATGVNAIERPLTLSLHIPTAAIDFILERYIEPAKLCMQRVQQRLQNQVNVPLQTITAAQMQQMTYLSPVYISTAFDSKSAHTLLHSSYGNGSNTVEFDEHKFPHIVFYIIPYNTKAPDVIVTDVLAGKRSTDQYSFVIELPQGIPLHPGAQEASILITQWLSSIANTKLDMFLLPQNW
jgi:hypothetical protein